MTALAAPPRGADAGGQAAPARKLRLRTTGAGRQHHGGRLAYAMLIVAALFSAFPFYWTIVAATRSNAELAQSPPSL
ncbi:MAG: cellobiose transport system permease protein, partial [Streptomyces sp.]|nr:cellobiose transport system permease protein [Streptomyces sp.]